MNTAMSPQEKNMLQRVNLIRIVLPLSLFMIVATYEGWEHYLQTGEFAFDIHFSMEVLFFGMLGPFAVFVVLAYLRHLLDEQIRTGQKLEELNRTLERKVADRTEELAMRNRELARANEELKELDQLKSDFVSLVSHELRGPLTTLNGGLELALTNADNLPAEPRRILQIMSEESKRLTDFVQTILDVSRLQAGKLNLTMGPVAVPPLLERACQIALAGTERQILWKLSDGLHPAWADENALDKIVRNLLSNAARYSPADSDIEIAAWQDNGDVKIAVTDYGPGIAYPLQPQIFERFFRVSRGDRINNKGWGLGLYFSKTLAEAHGGSLVLQSPAHPSPEPPGASFILTLPAAQADIPEDA